MTFRELREHAGLSALRLAKLAGVEQTTISQIERGKVRDPRWSTISSLAAVLGVSPGTIAKSIEQTTKAPKRRLAS